MSKNHFNATYSFVLGGLNFTVDIDDSLSAEYRRRNFPESHKKSLHYHPMHEIFFVFDNKISITLEDGCAEYEHSVVWLPPNTKHFTHRSDDYRILISCEPRGKKHDSFTDFFRSRLTSDKIYLTHDVPQCVRGYLEELCHAFYTETSDLTSDVAVSLLKLILYSLYKSAVHSKKSVKQTKSSRYLILSGAISRCTESEVTLKTVSEALNLSEKQTSRIILKYYGKPLSRLITEEKLSYAKELITSTPLPISEIALKCNFHSYKYFLRQFKESVGCSPLAYRKIQKQNKGD